MNSLQIRLQRLRRSNFARNILWMLCGQGSAILLQVFYFILLARIMGPTEYGVIAGAFGFTSLVSQYASFGSGTIFIRYVSGRAERFSLYWGNILLSTFTGGLLLSVALYQIARFILNPQSASIVFIATLANCLFAQLTLECGRVFQAFEMLHRTAILNLLNSLLRVVSGVVMALMWHHTSARQWSVVLLGVSIIGSIASVSLVSAKWGRPCFSASYSIRHCAEGTGYAFAMSASALYNDLDKTILSHYGMNLANGVYSLAYRVVDVASIPLSALREAVLPRLFRLGRSGIEGSAGLSLRVLKVAFPAGVVAAATMYVAAPLIPVLLGSEFSEAVFALRWLCIIPVFRSIHHMTGGALTGAGYQSLRTSAQISAAVVNLLLNLWLIPSHGWRGAAWASLVTDGLLAFACWQMLHLIRANKAINPALECYR